jgi:predicted lipid-binding transport protein (Tim44 family)
MRAIGNPMGGGFLDIIIFAAIALFLVFRLRSVLGRRTGHERPPPDRLSPQQREAPNNDNVVELPDRTARPDDAEDPDFIAPASDDPLAAGLTQIKIADSNFDPAEFTTGARAAFEMVVQAFAEGDLKTLRSLLNDEVYDNFSAAVQQREDANEVLETTVIGVNKADIIEARVEGRMAFITLKFLSEQVNVTRDKDGEVIDGDPNRITEITDIWTFARNTRARDPNWTLVETRSSN